MTFAEGVVRVRVPATSANLGPGFDTLGLALALYDEVEAEINYEGALDIDIDGYGRDELARDDTNLVAQTLYAALVFSGVTLPGVTMRCVNRIPHARGLGSSAAAIVTGMLLARGLWNGETNPHMRTDNDYFAAACIAEGHPDNVAPCVFGGFTVASQQGGAVVAVRREPHPAIRPVLFVPASTASTKVARGLLPDTVTHADAAFNAARAALLVAAMTGEPELLFEATEDRLHQSYRASAMPDSFALMTALRAEGHAAVISGAGPSVLVLAASEDEVRTAEDFAPADWDCRTLEVDRGGAEVSVR